MYLYTYYFLIQGQGTTHHLQKKTTLTLFLYPYPLYSVEHEKIEVFAKFQQSLTSETFILPQQVVHSRILMALTVKPIVMT